MAIRLRKRLERTIRERFPKITRIYIESRNRIDLHAARD